MTDDAMNEHPTPDELAELQADALEPTRAATLNAHVAQCSSCAEEVAALESVAQLLAELGAEPEPMPADVVASLDAALSRAEVERDAGVPSLADRRTERAEDSSPAVPARRRHRRWTMLAGAAAAVVIGVAAINSFDGLSGSDMDASSTADSSAEAGGGQPENADAPQGSDPSKATVGPASLPPVPAVDEQTLPTYAEALSHGRMIAVDGVKVPATTLLTSSSSRCPAATGRDFQDGLTTSVHWHGAPAVVVLDTSARKATVYDCAALGMPLFSTKY